MTRHLCRALDLGLAFFDVEIQRAEPLVNSNLITSAGDVDRMLDALEGL